MFSMPRYTEHLTNALDAMQEDDNSVSANTVTNKKGLYDHLVAREHITKTKRI